MCYPCPPGRFANSTGAPHCEKCQKGLKHPRAHGCQFLGQGVLEYLWYKMYQDAVIVYLSKKNIYVPGISDSDKNIFLHAMHIYIYLYL